MLTFLFKTNSKQRKEKKTVPNGGLTSFSWVGVWARAAQELQLLLVVNLEGKIPQRLSLGGARRNTRGHAGIGRRPSPHTARTHRC